MLSGFVYVTKQTDKVLAGMKEKMMDFGTEKVSVLFRKLFFPTLLGMLSLSAVTTIDGIFVGHGVGSDGIAAVNICIPLLMALTGIGLMIGAGCSVIASICLSKGKVLLARACVTQAMVFTAVISAVCVLLIIAFPEQTAWILGTSAHLLPMVVDYLVWFSPSLLFELLIAVALFAVRLDGAPKLAMWCSIVAAAVNAVLDWLFIFPFGWGVMGAALATSVSCFIGAVIAVGYMLFYAQSVRLRALHFGKRKTMFFFRNICRQCRIGSSALLGEVTMAVLLFVGNHVFMKFMGDDGVGAFGVSCYYLPFVFMVGNAIAQSAQPVISYNFGSGDMTRVNSAFRVSLAAVFVCGIVSTAAFVLFPEFLVALFLPLDTPAAQIAVKGFPCYGTGFLFFILNLSVIGFYQSVERIKPAIVFALLRGFVFLVPCFAVLPVVAGEKGIWLALPASETLTAFAILCAFVWAKAKSRQATTARRHGAKRTA